MPVLAGLRLVDVLALQHERDWLPGSGMPACSRPSLFEGDERVIVVVACGEVVRTTSRAMSRPGFVGDSQPCEGRSHASTEEVPG
jgi:hypothetical protein